MVLKGICFLFLKWTGNRVTFSFTRDPFISAVHHHTLWPAGTFALIFLAAEAVVRASVTILTKNAPLGVGVQVLVGLTWNDSWKLVTRYKLSSCCFVDAGLIGVWLSWLSTLTMYTTYNQTGDFSLCVQYKLRSWRVAGVMIHLSSRHCRDCFSTKAFNPFSWLWHQTESFTLHKRCHLRPTHCLLPAQFVHPKNIILQPQFVPGILDGWPRVGGYKHPYNYQLVWWEHQGTVVVFWRSCEFANKDPSNCVSRGASGTWSTPSSSTSSGLWRWFPPWPSRSWPAPARRQRPQPRRPRGPVARHSAQWGNGRIPRRGSLERTGFEAAKTWDFKAKWGWSHQFDHV